MGGATVNRDTVPDLRQNQGVDERRRAVRKISPSCGGRCGGPAPASGVESTSGNQTGSTLPHLVGMPRDRRSTESPPRSRSAARPGGLTSPRAPGSRPGGLTTPRAPGLDRPARPGGRWERPSDPRASRLYELGLRTGGSGLWCPSYLRTCQLGTVDLWQGPPDPEHPSPTGGTDYLRGLGRGFTPRGPVRLDK